jgi:hypothetical protein
LASNAGRDVRPLGFSRHGARSGLRRCASVPAPLWQRPTGRRRSLAGKPSGPKLRAGA